MSGTELIIITLFGIISSHQSSAQSLTQRGLPAFVSDEEKLYTALLRGYNPYIRPVRRATDTIQVNLTYSLMQIHNLDEKAQVFATNGWIIVEWTDERLSWDPVMFQNATEFNIESSQLWTPELALINGADTQFPDFSKYRTTISNKGEVRWEPAGVFDTSCKIDVTYYPYDKQVCEIVFGTWTYTSYKVNITNSSAKVLLDDYQINGEWHVVSTLVERREFIYDCCDHIRFSKVAAVIHMRRKHGFYTMNIVLPCLMLSILTLVTFLSPPEQGEKISLGISVLLSFSVFMLTLSENMPKISEFIPVFGVYTTSVMCMNTISVMLTVLVLNLHHRKSDTKVPRWMRKIIYGWLGRIMCVHGPLNSNRDGRGLYHMVRNRTGTGTNHSSAFTYDDSNKPHQHAAIYMQQYAPKETSQNNCTKVANADNKHITNDSKETHVPTPEEIKREKHRQACNDWKVLAQIVDRLFFWFSFITLLGLSGATFIILWT